MPAIKLWLDDVRKPPDDSWHWVRTAEEAVAWLRQDVVSCASLDHDLDLLNLGGEPKTGYDVACWLEKHPEHYPPGGVVVHSMNPVGAERMQVALAKAAQFWERKPVTPPPPAPPRSYDSLRAEREHLADVVRRGRR
jgi:hypothetical protein